MKRPLKGPRKGGRPLGEPEKNRTTTIKVRLNAEEFAKLQKRADRTRRGLSTYMRQTSLGARIVAPPSLENMEAAEQLLNIGRLLNQALKRVNEGLIRNIDPRVLEALRQEIRDTRLALKGVKR